jgi:endogenous inhibitor of DNA gyrase (YacG/DUF329 family)
MSEAPRCAYCRERPAVAAWRPFCSERCKLADLGRWLNGGYRIPGAAVDAGPASEPDDDADAQLDTHDH